jgi:hypothetical protein
MNKYETLQYYGKTIEQRLNSLDTIGNGAINHTAAQHCLVLHSYNRHCTLPALAKYLGTTENEAFNRYERYVNYAVAWLNDIFTNPHLC